MNVVIKANDQLLEQIRQYYASEIDQNTTIPYTKFVVDAKDLKVIAYQTNKVMFQGKNADEQAKLWSDQAISSESSTVSRTSNNNCFCAIIEEEQIGSDEVGTGDYFGPVVVCAAYLNQEILNSISHLNIQDSKNLSDSEIIMIAQDLKRLVPHYLYTLSNEKYNEANETNNQNMIKAKMHNFALSKTIDLVQRKPMIVVDQFCSKENYFKYLRDTKNVVDQICFETKAESKYLSVAIASIIARNEFLEEMDKLSNEVAMPLQKGASNLVDIQGVKLVKEYGFDILKKIAKIHFTNTQKIIDNLE